MALIPGGTFTMGGKSDADAVEYPPLPAHTVTVAAFCLDITEVTTGAYKACASCTPTRVVIDPELWEVDSPGTPMPPEPKGREDFCNQHKKGKDDHPINCATWDQAVAYCASLGRRLPTEEEWEYAARGGAEQRTYPWGEDPPKGEPSGDPSGGDGRQLCWWRWNEVRTYMDLPWDKLGTCRVKSCPAGAFGLFDMSGNVQEWTSTPYVCTSYDYNVKNCFDPYVTRGSSWKDIYYQGLNGTRRWQVSRRVTGPSLGFRCAKG
jgi:formylglycine-generating enzyme required for sulfatase activity